MSTVTICCFKRGQFSNKIDILSHKHSKALTGNAFEFPSCERGLLSRLTFFINTQQSHREKWWRELETAISSLTAPPINPNPVQPPGARVGWGACCSYFLVRKDIAFIWVHIALYSYIKWLHSAEFTVKTQPGNVGKVKIVKPSWGKVGTQTNSLQRNCNNTWQWWTPAHSPCGTMSRTSPLFVLTTKTYLLIFFKKLHNLASAETDLQDFFSVPCFQHCAAVLSHWCT